MSESNLLLLIGAPRSGTSWIAKILDSHPDVLYLHEPDTVLRSSQIATICPRSFARSDAHIALGAEYLKKLLAVRTLKSSGSMPTFRKSYRTSTAQWLRDGAVWTLLAADAAGAHRLARRLSIPDWILPDRNPLTVLKSVSSRGRLGVLGRAMPGSRIVFILRHPCGQVASMLAGIRQGKFEREVPFGEILACDEASEYGLTAGTFEKLSMLQKAAWHWAILNQKALNELADLKPSMVVRYEDFCSHPVEESKKLMEFAGLNWTAQTDKFLHKSTSAAGPRTYYSIVRNSTEAAVKWESELSSADQAAIMDIAAKVPVGSYYAATQSGALPIA